MNTGLLGIMSKQYPTEAITARQANHVLAIHPKEWVAGKQIVSKQVPYIGDWRLTRNGGLMGIAQEGAG